MIRPKWQTSALERLNRRVTGVDEIKRRKLQLCGHEKNEREIYSLQYGCYIWYELFRLRYKQVFFMKLFKTNNMDIEYRKDVSVAILV